MDTKRALEYGLDLKVALGIHPTNSNVNPERIFENLYKWTESHQIIAIGEIGLEDLTDNEIDIFKRQLDIANETNSKVIIHTPRKNKKEVLKVILDILPQHINENQAVIDHINPNVIADAIGNKPSDPLSVPKTVRELTRQGYSESEIKKVAESNAKKFFSI